jgi:hypothetical protein
MNVLILHGQLIEIVPSNMGLQPRLRVRCRVDCLSGMDGKELWRVSARFSGSSRPIIFYFAFFPFIIFFSFFFNFSIGAVAGGLLELERCKCVRWRNGTEEEEEGDGGNRNCFHVRQGGMKWMGHRIGQSCHR